MPDSGRVFLLRLHYELHGQNCENGYWFAASPTCGTGWTDALEELQALMLQFNNTVFLSIKQFMNQQCHFQRLDGSTKVPHEGPVNTIIYEAQTGNQAPDALPGHDAAVISIYDGFGGRSHRGRSYYGGCSEDLVSGGLLSPESFSDLQDVANEMMTRFSPLATLPCWVYQLYHPTNVAAGGQVIDSLSTVHRMQARREIRTQRHRMLGHGP